jgi:hypothetical protein
MKPAARTVTVLLLVAAASWPLTAAQTAPTKKPIDVYKEYQAAVKTATTITPILPFLTKEYQDNLKGAPKAQQDRMFAVFKKDAAWKDIVVTKETVKGETCEIETTAKDADGKAMTGKVAFIKEGGQWRIEGQGWVPDFGTGRP